MFQLVLLLSVGHNNGFNCDYLTKVYRSDIASGVFNKNAKHGEKHLY